VNSLRARSAILAAVCCVAAATAIASPIGRRPGQFADEQLNEAVAQMRQGNLKQADVILQQVLQKDPSQIYALLARAQVAMSEQRLADAERGIATVFKKDPERPEAHAMRGVILLLQKRPDEARAAFQHAIDLQPLYVTPRFYLAVIARSKGDYAGAAAEYKALTRVAPDAAAGYIGQAEAQMMLRNVPEAFRILQSWKTVPGAGAAPSYVIANVHLSRKEPAEAIRELNEVLAKNPGDSMALTYLGDANAVAGDRAKAIDSYRAALKADANNPVANNNLAWLLAEQGKELDEALRLAQAATTLDPNYLDAFDTLGWVRYTRGEYANAVSVLTKAAKLGPDRMDIAAHLGLSLAKTGSKAQALTELRRALASRADLPNRAELQRVVNELSSSSK